MSDMVTDELAPFAAELKLSKRWFESARDCALRGQLQAAAHCLERGLAVLDRVERKVLEERGE